MSAAIAMVLLGLVLTVKGGDLFVDAAVWLAEALGIPKFLVGATVVSLATTLPELAVSLLATVRNAPGIAAGNAVGSVCANLGLILGIGLCRAPVALDARQGSRMALMGLVAALLYSLCARGQLTVPGALGLLSLGGATLFQGAVSGRRHAQEELRGHPGRSASAFVVGAVKFVGGAAGIAAGARLLCDYGAALARLCGVPDGVIGATLVAVGTSLPELVTTLTALARGEASLGVGNVVGANLIDLTMILPLCALLGGGCMVLPRQSLALDMPFCLMLCTIAIIPPLWTGRF